MIQPWLHLEEAITQTLMTCTEGMKQRKGQGSLSMMLPLLCFISSYVKFIAHTQCTTYKVKNFSFVLIRLFFHICWDLNVGCFFFCTLKMGFHRSHHSFIKPSLLDCPGYVCPVNCFSYLTCAYLQFLQSHPQPLGCFSGVNTYIHVFCVV